LTRWCAEISEKTVPVSEDPIIRKGDAPWIVMDTRPTEEKFDWRPRYSVRQILTDTIRWIESNRSLLAGILDEA